MKKNLVALALAASLSTGVGAAIAQPLLMPSTPAVPVTVHAPVVATPTGVSVQSKLLNGYRSVRAFWLSRAIVR
jgi:hypothetical protein